MTPNVEQRSNPAQLKALHQLAVEMVVRLNVILKSARLYEANNVLFQQQVALFLELVRKGLAEAGEAAFTMRAGTLFFNSIRLKFGFANYSFFKFVQEEFRKVQLGGLRFDQGVAESDVQTLMTILARIDREAGRPFEAFAAEAAGQGLKTIRLEKMAPSDLAPKPERNSVKVFFLGMTHLEEAFASKSRDEKFRVGTTRRLMQSIFNAISDNESFVQGLTNIKNFHEYTLNHSMNVCILSIALGRRLGLDRNELVNLGISAFFHDFGKLDTPKEILEKPGKLDARERKIIEKHPFQGAGKLIQFIDLNKLPLQAIHVAMEHHVKEDFTGYPRYFKRQSINLFSKIVKITDFFDAITTKRVYRTSHFTRDEALPLMLAQSGKEFHPVLLREFAKMMGVYPVGTMVALDSGELGLVVEINPETVYLLRPRVKLITDAAGNKKDGETVDLTDHDAGGKDYARSIVKVLDPLKYGLNVADYFLARAV